MATVLLDSDAINDFLFGVERSVELIRSLAAGGDTVCLCDVVLTEVYSGVRPEDRERVAGVLADFPYLPTSPAAARQAGEWRYEFARAGVRLATSDVLVAATAHVHGAAAAHRKRRTLPHEGRRSPAAAEDTTR